MARISKLWAKAAPWIAGLAFVLLLVMVGVVIWQQYQSQQTLNEHTVTLTEVKSLRQDVESIVATAGPDITAGQRALINKLDWIECAVSNGEAACGPKP